MAPQQGPIAGSTTTSGISRTGSDLGSSKPACSSAASGAGSTAEGGSGGSGAGGLSGTASGSGSATSGGFPGTLNSDVTTVSFLTALSSATELENARAQPDGPNPEALKAWATNPSDPAAGSPGAVPTSPEEAADASDPHATDLNAFHAEARIERSLSTGHYTKIRGLGECCREGGKVELHRWHEAEREEDRIVVVKRILSKRVYANRGLERNERTVLRNRAQRHSEDPLTEIGVYSLLARQRDLPEYLLRMLTAFEAGGDVWLVLEHADGGDLFGVMQQADSAGGLPPNRLMRWMWQLIHSVNYLHRHQIGHRDISMENVLLRGDTVRLMDFGQAVRTHSPTGTELRYDATAGKPYYIGPECYVPKEPTVLVVAPAGARPGQVVFTTTSNGDHILEVLLPPPSGVPLALIPGTKTSAEPYGYAAAPADVFACGVVLFILASGLPPWREARPSDGHFAYAYAKGMPLLLQAWDRKLPALQEELMVSMLRWDPAKRPSAEACLSHQLFAPLHGTSVPTHCAVVEGPAPPPASPASPVSPRAETTQPGLAPGGAQPEELAALIQGLTAGGGGGVCMASGSDAYGWVGTEAEWAEQVSQTAFSADYYGRPEVRRGEDGMVGEGDYAGAAEPAAGDFYGSLAEERAEAAPQLEVEPSVREPPVPLGLPDLLDLTRHGAGAPSVPGGRFERFDDEAAPPEVPDVEGFRFEPTTLHVSGSTPADVGNHLLTFLTTVAGAEVSKVTCRKFTMKASISGDAGSCALKIRIYGEGEGRYAVEFQRRGGDAMALHMLFQRAVEYLERLVRALTPEGSRPSSACSERSEVDAAPLDGWTDPGVRGLLKRNRRRSLTVPTPGRGSPAGAPQRPSGCRGYGRRLVLAQ